MLQEGMEASLQKYNDGYIPEIKDENNIINIDVDVDKNNKEDDNIKNKEDNKENNSIEVMNNNLSISFKEK